MSAIPDIRNIIIPLFLAPERDGKINWDERKFLGTAFFVTKKGGALTAAHVIPNPADIPDKWRLCAPVQRGEATPIWGVSAASKFDDVDVAFIRVDIDASEYFKIDHRPLLMGEDVTAFGVPAHDSLGGGKELRLLKGHVSLSQKMTVQLNISLPQGMSGGPVLLASGVAGVIKGDVSTEATLETSEYVERIRDDREQITIAKIQRMHYYGEVTSLHAFADKQRGVLGNRSLYQLIDEENGG